MKPILEANNLIFSRSNGWKVDIESFSLTNNQFLGIIGANGAGKSTLMRLLAGVLTPNSGEILLYGKALYKYERSDIAKIIGYLPQEISYQFDYTVLQTVELGRFPHKGGFTRLSASDRHIVNQSLERTGLTKMKDRKLSQLSGGEKKRVALASVLTLEPQALLLDEPVAALDIHHQVQFYKLLRELSKGGISISVVTHELNLAALYCTDLMLVETGKITALGSPDEILTNSNIQRNYGDTVGVFEHPNSRGIVVLPL